MNKCIITNENVNDWVEIGNSFKYSLQFNSHKYSLHFAKEANWERFLTNERKLILKAWLWNAEWPVANETILTEPLLDRAIRQIPTPGNDFYKKLDYFLLNYYRKGGRELSPFAFSPSKHLAAFTDSISEFERLIDAGKQKKWIEEYDTKRSSKRIKFHIRLTDDGLKHCDQLAKNAGLYLLNKENRPLQGQKVLLVYAEEDLEWSKIAANAVGDRGASVIQHANGLTADNSSYLLNAKKSIKDCDFVILIKSSASDSIRIWGDMLAATSEEEEHSPEKAPFFFVLMTDDSQYEEYSYLNFKDGRLWDFRLIPHQEKLFLHVLSAISKRKPLKTNESQQEDINYVTRLRPEQFEWPKIKMTKAQRYWLGLLYSKFLKGEKLDIEKEEPLHWGKFGKEEKPTQLDYLLVSSNEIKLLGIWTIDKKSNLFQLFEDTVIGVRNLFLIKGGLKQVTTDDFRQINPKASPAELFCIGQLMWSHGFFNGMGSKDDGENTYNIDSGRRERFRLYPGIEQMVLKEVNERQDLNLEDDDDNGSEISEDDIGDIPEMFRSGTKIDLSDRPSKIVLGVQDLAVDVYEIINRLPEQIGRMIGIFGPWGRGKSILIEQISGLLAKADNNWENTSWRTRLAESLRLKKKLDHSKETIYIQIPFHAWKYQDTPASWAYMYECFADAYYQKPKSFWHTGGWVRYFIRLMRLNTFRTRLIPLLKITGIFSVTSLIILFLIRTNFQLTKHETELKLIGGTAIVTLAIALFDRVYKVYRTKASDLISRFTSRTSFKNEMGLQAEIQKELQILLRVWLGNQNSRYPKKRIVLLVEDIDRCSEEKIIHTIDGLRVMLENPEVAKNVIIICAVDERVLSRAVRAKYKDLMTTSKGTTHGSVNNYYEVNTYADYDTNNETDPSSPEPEELEKLISEYIDKLFILAIKLGKLSQQQRLELIDVFIGEIKDNENITADLFEEKTNPEEKDEPPKEVNDNKDTSSESTNTSEPNFASYGNQNINIGQNSSSKTKENKNASDIKFEPFTFYERDLLRSVVASWEGATPRQIRIFFYRYLLAKNLLIKRYSANGRENIWRLYPFAEYLPKSIVQYMNLHRPEEIYQKKLTLLEKELDEEENLPDNYSTPIQVKEYVELLSVLEIVIAY